MTQDTAPHGGKQHSWRQRTTTFAISPLKIISGFITILFFWTGVFILGVMAGRALPEQQAPLPMAQANASTQQNAHSSTAAATEDATIIHATDLRFQRTLRKKGLVDPPHEETSPQKSVPFKPVVVPTAPPPAISQPDTPPEQTDTATPPLHPSQLVRDTVPAEKKRYDYVYQLATFGAHEEKRIDSLRESLEGEGFRTRVMRTGNMRAVQLVVRGTPAIEEDVARVVKRLKLGQPWLRQKKALP